MYGENEIIFWLCIFSISILFSILALPIHLITAFIVSSVSKNKLYSCMILASINICCSIMNMVVYKKIKESKFIRNIRDNKIVIIIKDKIKKRPF